MNKNNILQEIKSKYNEHKWEEVLELISDINFDMYDLEFKKEVENIKRYALNELKEENNMSLYSCLPREKLFNKIFNPFSINDETINFFLSKFGEFTNEEQKKINDKLSSYNVNNKLKISILIALKDYEVNFPVSLYNTNTKTTISCNIQEIAKQLLVSRIKSSEQIIEFLQPVFLYYLCDKLNISDEELVEQTKLLSLNKPISPEYKKILAAALNAYITNVD